MPADYLGTMLECAAWLVEQEEAGAEGLSNELWQRHLLKWLPRFADDLMQHSRLLLYRSLGDCLSTITASRQTKENNHV